MLTTVLRLSHENKCGSIREMSPKLLLLGLRYEYSGNVFGTGGCNACLVTKVFISIRVWYPRRKQKDFDQTMLFMLMRMMQLHRMQASTVRQM